MVQRFVLSILHTFPGKICEVAPEGDAGFVGVGKRSPQSGVPVFLFLSPWDRCLDTRD